MKILFRFNDKMFLFILIISFISNQGLCVDTDGNTLEFMCDNCETNVLELSELTDLRLEYVKRQILKKLRLSQKPDVSRVSLPAPVANGLMLDVNEIKDDFDDYYGRTEQKIIFPIEGVNTCMTSSRYPSACLHFDLPEDLMPEDVSKVEFWFFKEPDKMDQYNQTFVISEAAHWDSQQKFKKNKPIAIHETGVSEGWLRVELAWYIRLWLERRERAHALLVECRTCHARRTPMALHNTHRPFLVLYTKYGAKKRHQRHLECSPGLTECCREPLYVDFSKLKWDDWIIQPAGYHAYFCKGTCAPISSMSSSGSYHNSIIHKYLYSMTNQNEELEKGKKSMKPCCAPTTFSSIQLFYMDSNNSVTQKTLPNMVVETCGCM